jgi:carboxyl-terminal processing protease
MLAYGRHSRMKGIMPRIFRRFLAIVALLGAWAFVGKDRAPVPLLADAVAGPAARADMGGESYHSDKPHDLSSLRIFTKVILYVKDNYVDPKRVKPKEMMIAALEYVEKAVPDVMVDGNADTGKVKVNVNGKVRDFDISKVDSLWKMSFTLKDVFDFISKNMRPVEDTRDVEYAAVNGMLSTLDPHSVLLRPEVYREMKLTTKGEFGGLGFVIQMKEGNLTVVKVLPKTPAYRAGIKKDDVIQKIGEESTVNMDLNEAVSKLRGPVDTKVVITVMRKAWDHPNVMTLARATISIESVQSKLLAGDVGYVRLKNFQGNTTRDLQQAIADLAKQAESTGGMKGIVLDLRGNPGGLLEQAIQVSDTFLSSGVIVATVGLSEKLREEKRAHPDDGDLTYPLAVLVNAGSASASEIVAGALKNLNRAVIIGRQTFGKGSVQVLYDFPDDSALKLTIAKYLTPGDISIQEIGIVPDIQLDQTRVTKDRVDVFAAHKTLGEADLEHHFGNPGSASVAKKRDDVLGREKPAEEFKYLKDEPKPKEAAKEPVDPTKAPKLTKADKAKGKGHDPLLDTPDGAPAQEEELDDQLDAESQDEIKEDFEVQFARDFVLKVPYVERDKMLAASKGFVDEKRREEQERIRAAIEALGVDWSPGETHPGQPVHGALDATLKPGPDQKILAGETLDLELTVENKGTETLHRIHAWTEADNGYLDRREFLFGTLKPGDRRSWRVPIKMPKDLTSRRDEVKVKFFADSDLLPEQLVSDLTFVELPRPAFAFNWQVIDDCAQCNGDGLVQRGEEIQLLIDVKNIGTGKALDSFASIKNAADQNIFIEKGRFKLGELAPGESKTARFLLEVKKGYKSGSFPLKVAILDEPLEEFATEKIELPISETQTADVEAKKGVVRVSDRAELYGAPTAEARPIASLPKGATLAEVGRVGGYDKVELDKGRFAFVKAEDAREAKSGKAAPPRDLNVMTFRDAPEIGLNADLSQGAIAVDQDRYTLTGTVKSDKGLLDLYILVNDQKVFFKGADPGQQKIAFSSDFALKEGNNSVVIVARQTSEFASRKALVVRRGPVAMAQKMTTK